MLEKLGVTVAWQGSTIEGVAAIAREADRLGFGYFWVPEAWGLEAFSTVAHILDGTTRIRVGVGIVNIFSRSAALIGMACATLDQLAPRRFILGLGSSGRSLVENWHGIAFSKPLKRTEEYVQVIKKVAGGENVDFRGEFLENLSRFRLFTKPLEPKNLEIYLGAIGDANLKLAGRISDGALLAEYPTSKLDRAFSLLNGEDNPGTKKKLFTYLHACVSNSEEELKRASIASSKNTAFYISSMGAYYSKNLIKLGYEEDVKRIIEARNRGGSEASAKAVGEKMVDELSLVGTPVSIVERLSKFPVSVIPVLGFNSRTREEVTSSINSMKNLAAQVVSN